MRFSHKLSTSFVSALILLVFSSSLVLGYYKDRLSPWSKIGHLQVANHSYQQFTKVVSDYLARSEIILILPDQEYKTSFTDLGISVDLDNYFKTRRLNTLTYTPQTYLVGDDTPPQITYDSAKGELRSLKARSEYLIDINSLIPSLTEEFGKDRIEVRPTYVVKDRVSDSLLAFNARLSRTLNAPLDIKLKVGNSYTYYSLPASVIRSSLTITSTDPSQDLVLDREVVLSEIISHLGAQERKYFVEDSAYQNILLAINQRFHGAEAISQVLGLDDGPTSSGNLAEKYLEIDLSQQKMYFFISGKLYKTYPVSTGEPYPTPLGEYHILNKAPKAFSSIYSAWMPYWMGFSYAKDVGAYLGIHEIAYAVGEDGKPYYRYGNYIGDKKTGGCIALAPQDSKEVYDLSDVGMLVRIVP